MIYLFFAGWAFGRGTMGWFALWLVLALFVMS